MPGPPVFAEALEELEAFTEGAILVGHNLPFDLAFWRAEKKRLGRKWYQPAYLDCRQLASVLFGRRMHLDLDGLVDHLRIPAVGRHSALGDAVMTAKVFAFLLEEAAKQGRANLESVMTLASQAHDVRLQQAEVGWPV